MPTLKQVTCSLGLGSQGTKLKEYGHRFTDGGVETLVAVPDAKVPFHIRVTTSGYIAQGLAVYVFIDGAYQCNRNRQRLQIPGPGTKSSDYEVDFTLRQKEEKVTDGTFIGRDWLFSKLKTVDADKAPDTNPRFAENVGTIEVLIVRCKDGPIATSAIAPGAAFSAVAPPVIPSVSRSKASSVRKSEAPAEIKASSQVASKKPPKARSEVPSKVPTKTHSKEPSKPPSKAPTKPLSKAPTAAGDDMMGGLFSLFDGAGDTIDRAGFSPTFFSPLNRRPYFNDERREQSRNQPDRYTIHGGYDYATRRPPNPGHYPRPQTAAQHYQPLFSPFHERVIPRVREHPPSPQQVPPYPTTPHQFQPQVYDYRNRTPRQAPTSLHQVNSSVQSDGFDLIQNLCTEVENTTKQAYAEGKKLAALQQKVEMYKSNPGLHLAALEAFRVKEQEVHSLNQEAGALVGSIFARMRRLDEEAWNRARDHLIVEKRLIPPNHPELQEWHNPKVQRSVCAPVNHHGANSRATPLGSVQEDSEGHQRESLAERKMRQCAQGTQAPLNRIGGDAWGADGSQKGSQAQNNDGWGNADQKDNNDWGSPDALDQPSNNNEGWGLNGDQKADSGWGNSSNKNQQDNGWTGGGGGNSNNADSWGNHGTNAGWDTESKKLKASEKPASNTGDNKSQKSQRPDGNDWEEQGQGNTGSWGNDNNGGWADDSKSKKSGTKPASNAAWGNDNNNGGWADDTKSKNSVTKPASNTWENDNNNGAWGDDSKSNKSGSKKAGQSWGAQDQGDAGEGVWGNDNYNDGWGNSKSTRSGSKKAENRGGWGDNNNDGGWDDDKPKKPGLKKIEDWGNLDQKSGGRDNKSKPKKGGGWNDKSQDNSKDRSAHSKVNGWNDGSKQNSQEDRDGWDATPAQRSHTRASTQEKAVSTMLEPVIKPYWAMWDKPDEEKEEKQRTKPRDPYQYPALSAPVAAPGKAKSVSYGVQVGRGANYTHESYQPEYLDTFAKPYAVFTFKYRSKGALEKILGRRIDDSDIKRAVQEVEKEALMRRPKDEIVEEMIKMKLARERPAPKHSATVEAPPNRAKAARDTPAPEKAVSIHDVWRNAPEVKPSNSARNVGWGNDNAKADQGWNQANDIVDQGWGNKCAWDKKSAPKKSQGGNGGWDNEFATKKSREDWNRGWDIGGDQGGRAADSGGGGGWDKPASRATSGRTGEHFAGDPGLKSKGVPDAGW